MRERVNFKKFQVTSEMSRELFKKAISSFQRVMQIRIPEFHRTANHDYFSEIGKKYISIPIVGFLAASSVKV